MIWRKIAASSLIALWVALSGLPVRASGDAPVHDRYIATAACDTGMGAPVKISSVMRDDGDAIDAVLQRIADLGLSCVQTEVTVNYLP